MGKCAAGAGDRKRVVAGCDSPAGVDRESGRTAARHRSGTEDGGSS